jgi:hypothetical protein
MTAQRKFQLLHSDKLKYYYTTESQLKILNLNHFRYLAKRTELNIRFKVCKSVHHRTIRINHQPDATIFQFFYPDVYCQLNMFRLFPAHHQELDDCSGSLWFYLRIVVTVVLCSWSGRPARPQKQHVCHRDTNVKPEVVTAVIEILMMGGKTPKTCWALNKRQDKRMTARSQTQHGCHYNTKVKKPEAVTAIIELLMMGGKTPKTCWAVNKRQDKKLKNCCILLVIYLNKYWMLHVYTRIPLYMVKYTFTDKRYIYIRTK